MHKRNNNNKVIIILCLLAVVVSLSIGFSVFSNNLIIKQGATVTPDPSDFKVLFSSSENSVVEGNPSISWHYGSGTGAVAKIDNTDPTHPKITGLKATFKSSGSYVQYKFYVINQGSYDAYLKKIEFGTKKCTAKEGTSKELVNQACNSIQLLINVSTGDISTSDIGLTTTYTNHLLKKGEHSTVYIMIKYLTDAALADGDFDVEFGDLTLTYSSVD